MINEHELVQEMAMLDKGIEKVTAELELLKGNIEQPVMLHVIRHGNGYQYYKRRKESETNGEYIKKKDISKAVTLAQIEYDERLLDSLQEAKKNIKKIESDGLVNPFETAMSQMSPGKRLLIKPHYISDEMYIRNWREQKYESLPFREDSSEYYTRSGIRVRSKSEVLIADILDEIAVPFLYEKPLHLKKRTVHPDFTLLNIKERKEVYWEHFGMMDDREYRDEALMKIREYESNGYYQFNSVIWTFESVKYPINTKVIRDLLISLLVSFGYPSGKLHS